MNPLAGKIAPTPEPLPIFPTQPPHDFNELVVKAKGADDIVTKMRSKIEQMSIEAANEFRTGLASYYSIAQLMHNSAAMTEERLSKMTKTIYLSASLRTIAKTGTLWHSYPVVQRIGYQYFADRLVDKVNLEDSSLIDMLKKQGSDFPTHFAFRVIEKFVSDDFELAELKHKLNALLKPVYDEMMKPKKGDEKAKSQA